jgi:hypothetical protein
MRDRREKKGYPTYPYGHEKTSTRQYQNDRRQEKEEEEVLEGGAEGEERTLIRGE